MVLDLHPVDQGRARVLGGGWEGRAALEDDLKDLQCLREGGGGGGDTGSAWREGRREGREFNARV